MVEDQPGCSWSSKVEITSFEPSKLLPPSSFNYSTFSTQAAKTLISYEPHVWYFCLSGKGKALSASNESYLLPHSKTNTSDKNQRNQTFLYMLEVRHFRICTHVLCFQSLCYIQNCHYDTYRKSALTFRSTILL